MIKDEIRGIVDKSMKFAFPSHLPKQIFLEVQFLFFYFPLIVEIFPLISVTSMQDLKQKTLI